MLLRIVIALLATLWISPAARAVCTHKSGPPKQLAIGPQVLHIAADAPIDSEVPVAQYDTPTVGYKVAYEKCLEGTEYGKRTQNLSGQNPTTRIFPTNVPGIGVKLLFSNGEAFGNFPSTSYMQFPSEPENAIHALWDIPAQSFYRVQFFKTGNIRLNNPTGETVLPPGQIAYNYLMTDNPASFTVSLRIGEIKVVSTPSCTADTAKNIHFDTVTPSLLKAGVKRALNFSIVCKSDYGSYSAKASMTTNSPSADGNYIRVSDSLGNKDRMGIRITDGLDRLMKVDGTTSESKNSITSQGPADFAWNATLIPGTTAIPAGGPFTASAEIVFDIQ